MLNLTGQIFGKLTVTGPGDSRRLAGGQTVRTWRCLCDCGTVAVVIGGNLRMGTTSSCGCGKKGSAHHNWSGGKRPDGHGYIKIVVPGHPRAGYENTVLEHVIVAEKALGRYLPKEHPVHHHDRNPSNNVNANLVICENASYHALLHRRMLIVEAGGDPNINKLCPACKCVLIRELDFNRSRASIDGRFSLCKRCVSARQAKKVVDYFAKKEKTNDA